MFILTTLDNNYKRVWEQEEKCKATFSSQYELPTVKNIQKLLPNTVYAIEIYRKLRSERQNLAPSLLIIKSINFIPLNRNNHDIEITFYFVKKLPKHLDYIIDKVKQKTTPLIFQVRGSNIELIKNALRQPA